MTAKSTARKSTRKSPSPAELKRQLAAEKAKGDQALDRMAMALEGVTGQLTSMQGQIDDLKQLPTKNQMLTNHDKAEKVINSVLNEDIGEEGVPEKQENILPDKLQQLVREFDRRKDARNNPVVLRETVDTEGQEIGQLEDRPMSSFGDASESLAPIRAVDDAIVFENKRYSKDKLDHELFMHELVLMKLHDTTDETQIQMPEVTNGGRNQYFIRGKMQWVRRLMIEPLARAKKTTYTQRKIRHDDGNEGYIQVPHTALMYPFEVLQDTTKGKQWLRNILAEPY